MTESQDNPCLACGACCTSFRVSFYWAEGPERGLPEALTEKLTPRLSCMAGTNNRQPRCAALTGGVGVAVSCGAYEARPTPCRDVEPGDDKCNRARELHGLPFLHAVSANPV